MSSACVKSSSNELRKRSKPIASGEKKSNTVEHFDEDIATVKKSLKYNASHHERKHNIASIAVVIMSFFTTFYKIWFPAQVVFDEVHFGKFAGYYLQRSFFFDVHPPLAKMMFAAVGYLVGFDGVYKFSNIGESYAANHVPYLALRALPATLNVFSVALVYHILRASGSSVLTCFVVATLYLLDNAFIGQNRLILLDSILIFYMLATVYSYIQFRKYRHLSFSYTWWKWLISTGICMALTLSVKMIGLFVVAAIGMSVLIDLWDLLDSKKYGLSNKQLVQHFTARFIGLITIPSIVYMFWFYVHFEILKYSGPGDAFMSPGFQDTLYDSPLRLQALDIMYNQSIKLQHGETTAFLHSHALRYPAQYEDSRYSSQGVQVTGNLKPDLNSYWRIKPTQEIDYSLGTHYVRHKDIIQLEHVGTGLDLLTHNVAAPLTPTNQEYTTVNHIQHYNDTLFRVELDSHKDSDVWSTMTKAVKLIHVKTGVALWCNSKNLPAWGMNHLEISGNKLAKEPRNNWVATDILGVNATEVNLGKDKTVKHMHFLVKFVELQLRMILHNNRLTGTHPYQSSPIVWPMMLRGISYWTEASSNGQIYLTGNIAGWWIGLTCIGVFSMIYMGHMILQKRDKVMMHEATRIRLTRTGGFFLLLWAMHYFPFFLMGRCLFLHHYLPAMACNYLLLGTVFDYLFVDGINTPISYQPHDKKFSLNQARLKLKSFVAAGILIGMQFMVYLFLSPLTYGTPGLSAEEATRRKVLKTWDIQFATP